MLVIVLFFSSAVASAWGKRDMPMHKRLESPGLGTLRTDYIALIVATKVDRGDSTVLLKCHCQCLEASHDTPVHESLEAPGLGTLRTDFSVLKVDGGDCAVLLKCHRQCLGGHP